MQNLMVRFRILLGIAVLLGLTACEEGEQRAYNVSTNPAVQARAVGLLKAMQEGNDEQIVKHYDKTFFVQQPQKEWLDKLKAIMAERGPMRSYYLSRSQADTRFTGKFYILEFNSVHNGRKRLHHLITLLTPVQGGGIKLIGHKMTPWEAETDDDAGAAVKQE